MDDAYGKRAVRLTKDIVKVAATALQKNLTTLGPLVLPYSELLKFIVSQLFRIFGLRRKPYQPDFKKAFQHFSFHAGKKSHQLPDAFTLKLKLKLSNCKCNLLCSSCRCHGLLRTRSAALSQ